MTNPNKGTKGTKEISKNWPNVSGLGEDEKHEGRTMNLVSEDGSNVSEKDKQLL